MVAVSNLLGITQERGRPRPALGVFQRLLAVDGMQFDNLEFLIRELARLEQDRVGNAYLADVVQWRRFLYQN